MTTRPSSLVSSGHLLRMCAGKDLLEGQTAPCSLSQVVARQTAAAATPGANRAQHRAHQERPVPSYPLPRQARPDRHAKDRQPGLHPPGRLSLSRGPLQTDGGVMKTSLALPAAPHSCPIKTYRPGSERSTGPPRTGCQTLLAVADLPGRTSFSPRRKRMQEKKVCCGDAAGRGRPPRFPGILTLPRPRSQMVLWPRQVVFRRTKRVGRGKWFRTSDPVCDRFVEACEPRALPRSVAKRASRGNLATPPPRFPLHVLSPLPIFHPYASPGPPGAGPPSKGGAGFAPKLYRLRNLWPRALAELRGVAGALAARALPESSFPTSLAHYSEGLSSWARRRKRALLQALASERGSTPRSSAWARWP